MRGGAISAYRMGPFLNSEITVARRRLPLEGKMASASGRGDAQEIASAPAYRSGRISSVVI